jgi:putative transposase
MRVSSQYRTVVVRLYPTEQQEKLLLKAEKEVLKFLELSRFELQKMLYHKIGEEVGISKRSLNLLVQRFTGSLGEKAILPFDDNAKFVNDNGIWFLEVQLFAGKGNRIRIPLAKTEVPYYSVLDELDGLPIVITRENSDWFAYVSIPVTTASNGLVVGVDFNYRKWVASPYEGRPLFFDVREYAEKIDRLQRLASRFQSRKEEEKVRECHRLIREIVKLAHGNFLSRIKESYGVCTIAMEDVEKMYKMIEEMDSKMTNNWLNTKTALRQFILRAMAKGFEVVEVDPKDTSRTCYKCGNPVKIYGKHNRLVSCESCGYRDYSRDLNAARNIARRGMENHY